MKKRTRRKIYPLVNTILHAIEGASLIDDAKIHKMRRREHDAIEAFRVGKATNQDWHELNDMASLTEVMAIDGVGGEALEVVKQAELHLKEALLRYRKIGKFGFSGPGLTTLIDLQEYHDLQRQMVSRGEYWSYIQKMINLRKSRAPNVEVL